MKVQSKSRSEERQGEIRKLQSEKHTLQADVTQLKSKLNSAEEKASSLEEEVSNLKASVAAKERSLNQVRRLPILLRFQVSGLRLGVLRIGELVI